jgi:hypothetical protein
MLCFSDFQPRLEQLDCTRQVLAHVHTSSCPARACVRVLCQVMPRYCLSDQKHLAHTFNEPTAAQVALLTQCLWVAPSLLPATPGPLTLSDGWRVTSRRQTAAVARTRARKLPLNISASGPWRTRAAAHQGASVAAQVHMDKSGAEPPSSTS